MQVTADNIKALAPNCKADIAAALAQSLPGVFAAYAIDTPLRVAHFLSQTAHESGGFTRFVENLNYSADGLRNTFPKYFKTVSADAYARQPEKIANRVYASRMGNGDEASGDGWRFRGRGLIQLTGKDNYTLFGKASGQDVLANPDYLAAPEGAAASAAWYWGYRGINKAADADDVTTVTKLINGGTIGLDERKKLLVVAKKVAANIFA